MTPVNSKRPELMLRTARQLCLEGRLSGPSLAAVGIDFNHGGSLLLGDNRLAAVMLEAGRAPGFGTEAIDLAIRGYLDGTHGAGRWQQERPPHLWEHGGGDDRLEALLTEEAAVITTREKLEDEMWRAWDRNQALRLVVDPATEQGVRVMGASILELEAATVAWEAARVREQRARGAVCNRQTRLQESWLQAQARG